MRELKHMARNRRIATCATALLVLVGLPLRSMADESNFSCAHGVISVGDATITVLKKCGEPLGRENVAGGGAEDTKENWFYGGGNRLSYRFIFRAGMLVAIERMSP